MLLQAPVQSIQFKNFKSDVLRLDLIHPLYGGNKYFKLKHNLDAARQQQLPVLSFGGVHSNHIFSLAAFCKEQNISSVGVIRGEKSSIAHSPTLQFAAENGMQLHFISREEYDRKDQPEFLEKLKRIFGDYFLVPEGGNNMEGVRGCAEILPVSASAYDYIFCACGTACTYAGIKISARNQQKIIGVSVLKGEDLLTGVVNLWLNKWNKNTISFIQTNDTVISDSVILSDYHFGGYARYNQVIVDFKNEFESSVGIPVDYIYTSKLFYAVFDLLGKRRIPSDAKLLIVHSGGLQGNAGFEQRYKSKIKIQDQDQGVRIKW